MNRLRSTFRPRGHPRTSANDAQRCWADDDYGVGDCGQRPTTAIGLCDRHWRSKISAQQSSENLVLPKPGVLA